MVGIVRKLDYPYFVQRKRCLFEQYVMYAVLCKLYRACTIIHCRCATKLTCVMIQHLRVCVTGRMHVHNNWERGLQEHGEATF